MRSLRCTSYARLISITDRNILRSGVANWRRNLTSQLRMKPRAEPQQYAADNESGEPNKLISFFLFKYQMSEPIASSWVLTIAICMYVYTYINLYEYLKQNSVKSSCVFAGISFILIMWIANMKEKYVRIYIEN